FIFVVLSVVFNRKRMMLWLLSSVLATQVWIWYKSPVAIVRVDSGDYAGRILIFILCIWLAYYVNNIYIRRLEENEAQIGFQKLISDISANFVTVNEENLESRIKDMISLCGKSFSVDRVLLVGFPGKIASMEWFTEGTGPVLGTLRDFNAKHFQWWLKQTYRNEIVHIPDVLLLPPEAEEMKTALTGKQVKSLLSVPVRKRGAIEAVLVFVSYKEARTWKKQHQDILRILANLLSDALTKVETEMEISHMAYYDSLTGLPNRFLFNNRLQQAIHHSKRTGKLLGVVLLDLDSFKTVNDTMGHDSGDEILKQVAQKLTGCLRQQDTVARFGGDEFLILVNMLEQVGDMRLIAEKIMKALELPLTVGGQEFFITASAGIAVYPVDGEDPELLIKNADVAMYASKDKGKNQYTLCSPSIKEDVLKRMKLTNSLYRALERNELELFYQPQVNPSTSLITGVEALIRWKHPELGMVSPGVFIPLAEKNGLIKPIGQWVLQTAARQLKAWQDKGFNPLRMAVNISVEQFRDSSFVRHVEKVLAETGLASGCLELEITEGIAVKEEGFIMSLLHVLKQLGVDIAIDDFGTEYSSLNRLKTLPVDRIKIDMQFVRNIAAGSKDEAIVKAIIQLAKNLKLEVIAEGVETEEECEFFSDNQCDHIQGYYYYRPMPANELEAILEKQYHFE
ncbi:MAG: EAL domain-containing protein, partial [Clostridiales bacterium]|nr:EAL domain-containing protein [Clostridiales bacterium]